MPAQSPQSKPILRCLQFGLGLLLLGGVLSEALAADWSQNVSPLAYYRSFSNPALISLQYENPADLYLDQSKDNSFYSIYFDGENGNLKRAFDPKSKADQSFTAGGSRHFGQRNLFSGSFNYHRQALYDKKWIHNSNPYVALPFLLADSSVGDFRLNGLYWEVTYAREWIPRKLFSGTTIFYNVDETYKTVFPKPQINHRDIMLTNGLNFRASEKFYFGLTALYFDFQENMETSKYNQDQQKTPTFYKIRGLDNPLIFKGETSEERLMTTQGFDLKANGELNLSHVIFNWLGGFEKAQCQNTDGGAYPVAQGKWHSQAEFFKTDLALKINPTFSLSLFIQGHRRALSANHPDMDIRIYSSRSQDLTSGINPVFSIRNISIGGKYSYISQTLRQTDNYNGILHYYPAGVNCLELNLATTGAGKYNLGIDFGYDQMASGDTKYFSERTDWFYDLITRTDAEYYTCVKRLTWAQINFSVRSNAHRQYSILVKYGLINTDTAEPIKTDRSFLTVNLVAAQN